MRLKKVSSERKNICNSGLEEDKKLKLYKTDRNFDTINSSQEKHLRKRPKMVFRDVISRYIPVGSSANQDIAYIVQRLIWNLGIWHHQSLGLHWFAKFAIFCFISTSLTQVATLVIERKNATRMFETLSIFSFCCMGNLKLFSLYINIKHWAFIISQMKLLEHEQLDGKLLSYADIAEDYSPEIIAKYTKRYTIVFSILLRLYSVTLVVFVATPFFEYALTAGTGYPHILPGWAPLDDYFLGYILTLIFEVIASVYCVFVHVAFDCASVGIMIFICGQFSLLRRRTEDIAGGGEDCMPNAERDVRAHLRIIESHGTHIVLCTVIKKLDTLLRIILGVYFLVATLTFCAVAVRLSSETLSFMQLVSLLQYMAGSLTQLFLFCRYGDAVFHESSFDMGEGPFGAAWWSLSPRMRRELVMLAAGMIQPRTLHAGPFNQLDLPSFVQVVRAAYSYYAVVGQTK